MKILIPPQTAAAESLPLSLGQNRAMQISTTPVTLYVIGTLGVTENVSAQYHDGTTWRPLNVDGNNGIVLDEDNAVRTIFGPLEFRVVKSATATEVGVGITPIAGA